MRAGKRPIVQSYPVLPDELLDLRQTSHARPQDCTMSAECQQGSAGIGDLSVRQYNQVRQFQQLDELIILGSAKYAVDVGGAPGQFQDSLLELGVRNAACNNEVDVIAAQTPELLVQQVDALVGADPAEGQDHLCPCGNAQRLPGRQVAWRGGMRFGYPL